MRLKPHMFHCYVNRKSTVSTVMKSVGIKDAEQSDCCSRDMAGLVSNLQHSDHDDCCGTGMNIEGLEDDLFELSVEMRR